jgi:hypothetical protein
MPGNPTECRLHALRCSQLAKTAATLESRRAFIALRPPDEPPGAVLSLGGRVFVGTSHFNTSGTFLRTQKRTRDRRPLPPHRRNPLAGRPLEFLIGLHR